MNILLADSRPLFHSDLLLSILRRQITRQRLTRGVYIGAANHDEPEFYRLACGAFIRYGLSDHQHLHSGEESALNTVTDPALIILAGGSMEPGWDYLSQTAVRHWLDRQRQAGAVFIGISAGALHLSSGLNGDGEWQTYLGWTPLAVAVHEEAEQWPSITTLQHAGAGRIAAIPFGEGIVDNDDPLFSLNGKAFICGSATPLAQAQTITRPAD